MNMDARFLRNVALKALALFVVFNLIFAVGSPSGLGNFSLYNRLFTGRQRFPFGEDSARSYNLSLFDLDAMFASHIIAAAPKPADEYRVILVGDSSIWGTLLRPEETLAGQLNAARLSVCGRALRAYNLGYPTISLTKDLMILDYALRYQPDLIVWGVTLEAFPMDKQLSTPLVANNATRVDDLSRQYQLGFSPDDPALIRPKWWDRTLIGQRRALADLLRLQIYGVLWSATGIDQTYPDDYPPAQTDLEADEAFHAMQPPHLDEAQLAFGVLENALHIVGKKIPMIVLNEPMLVSTGENSHIRYNFFYPRWAYDQYRQSMAARAASGRWTYLDAWGLVPADQFTNSAIHLTPTGESLLAARVGQSISHQSCMP